MHFLLTFIGYLINSVLIVFVVVILVRIFAYMKKKEVETLPAGMLIKELTDLILKGVKYFLPIRGELGSYVVTLFVLIGLFWLVRRFLIL